MMLLYVSSRAADHLGRVLYDRKDLAGNIAFEAADLAPENALDFE